MSELVDKMELRNTGNRSTDLGPVQVVSNTSINEAQYDIRALYEWRLDVNIGCKIIGTAEEVKWRVEHKTKPMIEHIIFGEFERDLYEIKHAAYNRDYKQVEKLVDKIHSNMFTYKR